MGLTRSTPIEQRILMNGLDAAGKTTILYNFHQGEVVTTIPTIGFNVETLTFKSISFTSWDVGGRDKIRPLWRHYYQNTEAMVFVVDSNDRDRTQEARNELQQFLREDELRGVPVLVWANKQDLPHALSVQELQDLLHLNDIRDREWHIQGCTAIEGDGITEGLTWLNEAMKRAKARS